MLGGIESAMGSVPTNVSVGRPHVIRPTSDGRNVEQLHAIENLYQFLSISLLLVVILFEAMYLNFHACL